MRHRLASILVLIAVSAQADTVFQYLPEPDQNPERTTFPWLVSPDGTLVVGGTQIVSDFGHAGVGVHWTEASGWSLAESPGYFDNFTNLAYTGITQGNVLSFTQYGFHGSGEALGHTAPDALPPGTPLPPPAGCAGSEDFVSADAITPDGAAIVGSTLCGAHRWTAATGTIVIAPPGSESASATAVSDDGAVVAGYVGTATRSPFVWSESGGFQVLAVELWEPGSRYGPLLSADGTTLVGTAVTPEGRQAFVWDEAHGVTLLGDLAGGTFESRARGVSADGSLVAGTGRSALGTEAFAWTRSGGMVGIGFRSDTDVNGGVTPSGLVFGQKVSHATEDTFLWNPASGWTTSVEALLRANPANTIPAGGIHRLMDVSGDGRVIVGFTPSRPWVATLWTLCENGLDDDGDGLADLDDPGCTDLADVSERDASLVCDDGVDNDGDGLADYVADADLDGISDAPGDPACMSPLFARESSICQDGANNDGQLGTDYDGGASRGVSDPDGPDPQCVGKPWRDREIAGGCGLGVELALAMSLVAALARRRVARGS